MCLCVQTCSHWWLLVIFHLRGSWVFIVQQNWEHISAEIVLSEDFAHCPYGFSRSSSSRLVMQWRASVRVYPWSWVIDMSKLIFRWCILMFLAMRFEYVMIMIRLMRSPYTLKHYNRWFRGSVTFFSVPIMQKSVDTIKCERFAKDAG